jgi:hypothetical protein
MMSGGLKKKGWTPVWCYRRLFSSGAFDERKMKAMAMEMKWMTLGVKSLDEYEQSFYSPTLYCYR